MGTRVWLLLGGLVIAGVVAWLLVRGDAAPRAPAHSGRPAAPAAPAAPAGPSLPAIDAGPQNAEQPTLEPPRLPAETPPPAEQAFAAEPRDDAWAATTEREIERRFTKIRGGKLVGTECRRAQCRIVVTGSEPELADTIADLEGPRGMHGFAKNVLLTAPIPQPDGAIELRAFLRFDRPQ